MRLSNPAHPGKFMKTEVMDAYNLSVTGAAAILGVSRPTLSTFLNQRSDLSGDRALRIEKAFGVDMETLMRMQNSYDIARTRKRANQIKVSRFHPAEADRVTTP